MGKSMEKLGPSDPRLTAYALGELDESERRVLEAELALAPELESELADIASMARALEHGLASEAPEALSDGQRSAVEVALAKRKVSGEELSAERVEEWLGEEPAQALRAPEPSASGKKAPALLIPSRPSREGPNKGARRVFSWLAASAAAAAMVAAAGSLFVTSGMRSASSSKQQMATERAKGAYRAEDEEVVAQRVPQGMGARNENGLLGGKGDGAHERGNHLGRTNDPDQMLDGYAKNRERLKVDTETWKPPSGLAPSARAKCDPRDPLCDEGGLAPAPPPLATENPFVEAQRDTKSTFSIDVDTASYSWVRRSIEEGHLPAPSEVRIEELVNYFPYEYAAPAVSASATGDAFSVSTDVAEAPWDRAHRLLRVGIKGKTVSQRERPGSNLVFLVDVSGSMASADRLPLLVSALKLLVDTLDQRDRVSIVVYAAASGVILPSTSGTDKSAIRKALEELRPGGSTNGSSGIELAYAEAAKNFVRGGTNRVLLATDGDFNVGVSSREELERLITEKAKGGVFLSVLGVGSGNYRDNALEALADKGNGNYAYLDSVDEAKKVLVEQASGTLVTIAKDVKIQMTFDPKEVKSFRLIGYENRMLAHGDFADDRKDAGEIGAGHTVTALYEIVPVESAPPHKGAHLGDVALRFKEPDGQTSRLIERKVTDSGARFEDAETDFRFAASVAGFGMLLRGSKLQGDLGYADVARFAAASLGEDPLAYRKEFVALVRKTAEVSGKP